MGRRYTGHGTGAVGTDKSLLTLISATTIRPCLYEIITGCEATPADQATDFKVVRFTAVGVEGSGFTPLAHDPADPASLADYGSGVFGTEPTYTASAFLLQWSQNQRVTFRFVTIPEMGFLAPATAANGIGIKSSSATGTATHEASACHVE